MCLWSCVCLRGNALRGRAPVLVPPGPEHTVGYCGEWWEYKGGTRGLTGHPLPPLLEAGRKRNKPTHRDSRTCRVGALVGRPGQKQVKDAQALYRPAEQNPEADFMEVTVGLDGCAPMIPH